MMSSAIYCLRQSVIFCAILITSQQPGSASAFVVGAAHRNRCTRSERQGKKISASSVARKTANMDLDGPTQEWDVNRYQSLHSFVYEYGSSLVDLADPRAGERILDVGCGSGELTNALYEHAKQNNHHGEQSETSGGAVIGVDLDINMIQKAQEQYPHLHFAQADARNLDLASLVHGQDEPGAAVSDDPRVDLLFSNAALHWIPPKDAPKAVAAMAKALKPGGRFVVEFGGVGNVQQIAQACQDATGVQAIDFWYFPSIPEFSALLQANGIEVTSAVLFDRPTQLEEGDAGLSNWIRMFGNKFLDNLSSEEEVDDALKKINDKLKATMWDGTTWTADYRRIRIAGRKLISKTRN